MTTKSLVFFYQNFYSSKNFLFTYYMQEFKKFNELYLQTNYYSIIRMQKFDVMALDLT